MDNMPFHRDNVSLGNVRALYYESFAKKKKMYVPSTFGNAVTRKF